MTVDFDKTPTPRPTSGFDFNAPTIVALLYIASFAFGITSIVGVVLAYVWRDEPHEPWAESHFQFHIRTFWLGLVGGIIGGVLIFVVVGFLLLFALAVWFAVRSIKALLAAQRREPIPVPETWLW